ncbi:hypothetical protein EW026_g3090 [Hermanssonia centrifuga]|uniref:Uncharacterized protein n=1 Tax=Hermanssonia centrifuga TaxID=98765 RepID=A0A4S4KMB7_9APHY|nr:hypothetical protein EW026_g3090 [Hermanssonia centrifuga]
MQLTDSERQWEAKKQELNSIVYRMIDSEFWPVVPQTPDMVSPEERFRDLRTTVWELKGQAQELYEMMRTVKARGPSPVSAHPIKEHQDSEQPPAKRRRVSESTETKLPILPPAQPDSVISKELDALGDRFNALDVRLSDLENDMVQYDNEMFAELDERIEEKLAASSIPSSTGPEGDSAAPETIDTGQTMATRLQELEMDLAGAGKDIEEVAKEIGSIIKHAGEADAEIDKLRKENEAMRKQIVALDEQQKHNNEALKTYKAELDALNAAVSTYMTQSTTPPPQSLPDMGGILESIAPSMLAAVRQDIQPLLADVRSNVEDLLRKQSTELSTAVMAKLSLTLKTVEMISEWMEQMSQGGMPNGVQYANGGTLSGAARGNMLPPMKGDITVNFFM